MENAFETIKILPLGTAGFFNEWGRQKLADRFSLPFWQ